MEKTLSALFGSLLLATSVAEGQFNYTTNADGCSITITGYSGAGGAVIIPAVINGRPVTGLGADAFYLCTKVTSITIPGSVRSMGDYAFYECTGLTNVIIANGF